MFKDAKAFNGFSVNDLAAAKKFYSEVLGVDVKEDTKMNILILLIPNTNGTLIYQKDDHVPATYTILNFPVADIDVAHKALTEKGVKFEKYEGMTEDNGIAYGLKHNMGPNIAWFKDPAGNVLSILQEK